MDKDDIVFCKISTLDKKFIKGNSYKITNIYNSCDSKIIFVINKTSDIVGFYTSGGTYIFKYYFCLLKKLRKEKLKKLKI